MNIASLATYIPPARVHLDQVIAHRGGVPSEARTFSQLFGMRQVATLAGDESAEGCFHALLQQLAENLDDGERIDAIILIQGLPAHSRRQSVNLSTLRRRSHFITPNAPLLTLNQQNCATLFWGLRLAEQLLASGKHHCIALLVGDTLADFDLAERYIPGCTMIADGFAAALLKPGSGQCNVSGIQCFYHPGFQEGLDGTRENTKRFYQSHNYLVEHALASFPEDVRQHAWLLPHNINRLSWQTWLRHAENRGRSVATDLLGECGHCYAADPLLLLERYAPQHTGRPALLLSVGLGGWVGCAAITCDTLQEATPC
ncbi:3-oxoacyl-[acyl-carrier-protein] synthase III C-terminal domain-containing protein [Pseudomonas sp. MWU13-2517]|uniref:3-oxoacyl-[acyl-carrier-protein] synthase III C-terminal domain-containing protein n=1 Tax=Pseudomonas sp. MWU13-2517 TaxID=2929055 RepID=UPI00200F8C1D|nr:3-oxoacyl-[acyl-carrier-protein] synthase III C-terminal domain-containing protein [Pseudomonas sp. MWU13-2517]